MKRRNRRKWKRYACLFCGKRTCSRRARMHTRCIHKAIVTVIVHATAMRFMPTDKLKELAQT